MRTRRDTLCAHSTCEPFRAKRPDAALRTSDGQLTPSDLRNSSSQSRFGATGRRAKRWPAVDLRQRCVLRGISVPSTPNPLGSHRFRVCMSYFRALSLADGSTLHQDGNRLTHCTRRSRSGCGNDSNSVYPSSSTGTSSLPHTRVPAVGRWRET